VTPTAQNICDVRELAECIELWRGAALEADAAGLGFRAAWHRADVHSGEIILREHVQRCGLVLGPVAPRTS